MIYVRKSLDESFRIIIKNVLIFKFTVMQNVENNPIILSRCRRVKVR